MFHWCSTIFVALVTQERMIVSSFPPVLKETCFLFYIDNVLFLTVADLSSINNEIC